MTRACTVALFAFLAAAPGAFAQTPPPTDPALQPVLDKMAQDIATYGEKASMFVGVEKYSQSVNFPDFPMVPPRKWSRSSRSSKSPATWAGLASATSSK